MWESRFAEHRLTRRKALHKKRKKEDAPISRRKVPFTPKMVLKVG